LLELFFEYFTTTLIHRKKYFHLKAPFRGLEIETLMS
jgi:hypothetical protein